MYPISSFTLTSWDFHPRGPKRLSIWSLTSKRKVSLLADLKELEEGFFDTLTVLKDVLPEMVVVGGWCPYLYSLHLWKISIPDIPTTTDIDFGVLETGNRRFEKTVYDRLRSAGYALERLYTKEETPVEFIYKTRKKL